ncbi:hypothetical protein [Shewanella glacialipiscicola]|uniref:hypothetical protein n=1 Tax=Shewanella glacialipiscicola TaxID=614069 RepID=UPI003D799807
MTQWLLGRLQELSSEPLQPHFALQGATNWLRALAILTDNETNISSQIQELYANTQRRVNCRSLDTLAFENIHFAFQNIASLNALNNDVEFKHDICNSAIICWHDSIVFSAKAMILSFYEDEATNLHDDLTLLSKTWQDVIIDNKLIIFPFSLSVPTLVKKEAEALIKNYRGSNSYALDYPVKNEKMALGGVYSYLNGTLGYELWKKEASIKETDDFKSLGVDNFRTNKAKQYRDSILSKSCVNFLVQAERFRGKSNYRDSLFLSYGENNSELLDLFITDLLSVSKVFLKCAVSYCSRRVESGTWDSFLSDIEENTCLTEEIKTIEPY